MRITTKVRYGLRALLEIATRSKDREPIPLSAISDSQEISRKYLEQLVGALRKANLVGSRKGVRGGYYLVREPSEISLWDVITSLEGRVPLVDCIPHPELCSRSAFCTTRSIWELLDTRLEEFWRGFTLQDLLDRLPEIEQRLEADRTDRRAADA